MSKPLEEEIVDWVTWYQEHKHDAGDVLMKMAFLNKCIHGLLNMLLLAAKDIQKLEQRTGASSLYLPSGLGVRGDVTRLG